MNAGTSCDVLIVGAGVVGCAIASDLARRECDVLLVDRAEVCSGSSGRTAGGVRHQFAEELNISLAARTIARIKEFPEEFGVDPGFREVGYLFLASTEESEASLRRSIDKQRRVGVRARFVERTEIAELVPGVRIDDLRGGAYCPDDGYLDPHTLVAGLAADAVRHHARLRQDAEVAKCEIRGGRLRAVRLANDERIICGTLLNCAGAWADALAHRYGAHLPIVPSRSQVFALVDVGELSADIPMTIDFDNDKVYFHADERGLLAGIDQAARVGLAWDIEFDWSQVESLAERLAYRVPQLGRARVSGGWAGFLELTPDENPLVGWHHLENTYVAAGFSGHGLSIALGLAEEVGRELSGEKALRQLDLYRPERFASGALRVEALSMH